MAEGRVSTRHAKDSLCTEHSKGSCSVMFTKRSQESLQVFFLYGREVTPEMTYEFSLKQTV